MYPITNETKDTETNTIRNILRNNEYYTRAISKLPPPKKQNTQLDSQNHKTKWATFTYSGKEVKKVTNLFRDTNIKFTFRTRNTIQDILRPRPQIDKHNRGGIYRMKCMDCPLKYVGQTGRTFNTRYKEYIHDVRSNNSNTGYANYILNTGHTYGTITDTMEIMKTERKGRLEIYHIYEIGKDNLHMNDTNIDIHNHIFKALHKIYTK
jgi:hypothetical protein